MHSLFGNTKKASSSNVYEFNNLPEQILPTNQNITPSPSGNQNPFPNSNQSNNTPNILRRVVNTSKQVGDTIVKGVNTGKENVYKLPTTVKKGVSTVNDALINIGKQVLNKDDVPFICIANPKFTQEGENTLLENPEFVYHKNGKYYTFSNNRIVVDPYTNELSNPKMIKVDRASFKKKGGRKTIHRKRKHRKLNTRKKK